MSKNKSTKWRSLGLKHLKEKGQINIQFQPLNNQLEISISDNGIGREKAKQYSLMSTGKGLKIVNEALKLHFQLKKVKINYNVSDIYDEQQNVAGTRIEITVPI
ncbi:MAG: ATP-binding protein [Prolixibacteraceae bacterium]|nr:ATP-binding protein [Prolixibacteraceae bacterium]